MGLFGRKKGSDEDGQKNQQHQQQQQKSFKCEHCSMTFDEKDRLKRHKRKAHAERGDDMPNVNPFGFR